MGGPKAGETQSLAFVVSNESITGKLFTACNNLTSSASLSSSMMRKMPLGLRGRRWYFSQASPTVGV